MFDPAEYLDRSTGDVRIRVECIPTARDEDHPIRLVLVDWDDTVLTELKFTPGRANDSASSIARLLGEFIPRIDSWKLAEGLRTAAIKVWAARN
jgi:hypothetical protein